MSRNLYPIVVVLCLCFSAGCMQNGILGVDRCADIPAGSIPEPVGSKLCRLQTAQATSALADQTVLYQSDFIGKSTQLSPAAIERVQRMVQNGGSTQQTTWVIEPSSSEQLDQSRVNDFVYYLGSLGVPPIDVVVATPAALGLSGPVAERVVSGLNQNRMNNTGNIGNNGNIGTGQAGAF